jgi:N-formylglutamate deformylase
VLQANYSRYVIDLNRPSSGESLYPGQTTTGLCPAETFRGEPLYHDGGAPAAADVAERVERYWQPYHRALRAELDRLLALHGQVLLWEAHSIASVLPRLFDGQLPALNIGTFDGKSCAPAIHDATVGATAAGPFSWVANGRFKGGYITRHYGEPARGVHAVQLEMTQCMYMDETAPFAYREDLAAQVLPTLEKMVRAALAALPERA